MTHFFGTGGSDEFVGGGESDLFTMSGGGRDTVSGGGGDDQIYMYEHLDNGDRLDGGDGNDLVGIKGDYSDGLTLTGRMMANVEQLRLDSDGSYKITLDGTVIPEGRVLSIDTDGDLDLDATAESLGRLSVGLGQGWRGTILGGDGGLDVITSLPLAPNQVFRGGAGLDSISLDNVGIHVRVSAAAVSGFETILLTGHGVYRFTDDMVQAGQAIVINANDAGPTTINASQETDGAYHMLGSTFASVTMLGGAGDDTLQGGLQRDVIAGGGGGDILTGLGDGDRFNFPA